MASKRCNKCGKTKPLSDYYYRKDRGVYTGRCKECIRQARLDYYYDNREVEKSRFRQRYEANTDDYRERAREYYKQNAEEIKARTATYNQANAEWKREYDRRYAQEHPGVRRKARRRWSKRNPVKQRVINMRKRRRRKGAEGDFTDRQWKSLVSHYAPDGRCLCCKKQSKLAMDHVVALASGGSNYIANMQPLCKVCNSAKGEKTIDFRPDDGAFAKSLMGAQDV